MVKRFILALSFDKGLLERIEWTKDPGEVEVALKKFLLDAYSSEIQINMDREMANPYPMTLLIYIATQTKKRISNNTLLMAILLSYKIIFGKICQKRGMGHVEELYHQAKWGDENVLHQNR